MDRGFFSVSNIIELSNSDRNLSIIIPLPFSLKLSKELIVNNQDIKNTENMFKYNDEILYHKVVPTKIKNKTSSVDMFAHIFFNEKAEVQLRHQFYFKLFTYEEKIKKNIIKDEDDFEVFVNQELPDSIKKYYYFDKTDKTVKRNEEKINEYLLKLGYFITLTTEKELSNETVLSYYRDKDKIEKIFDTSKNELNTNRLHSHSKPATEGRLLVKFIATIIYQQITKIMRENNMFKKYSVTDMLKELSKLKMYSIPDIENFTTECSKNNRDILKLFNLEIKQ
jgi:transposase